MTVLMSLAHRLRAARLYLCTDAREKQGDLSAFLTAAFAGGVDVVQIRQAHMTRSAELAALEVARDAARSRQGIVAVDGAVAVAHAFSSDMLHLGASGGSARRAHRHLHEWALVGRSATSVAACDEAVAEPGLDYFSVGAVWATPTKPDATVAGLGLVRHAARVAPVADIDSRPWFAVGGINADTLDDVVEAGARRIVVVSAITEAADPEAAARTLKERLGAAWANDPTLASYALRAARADFS